MKHSMDHTVTRASCRAQTGRGTGHRHHHLDPVSMPYMPLPRTCPDDRPRCVRATSLRKLDFPLSHCWLGFTWGMMERNLRRALSSSDGNLGILWRQARLPWGLCGSWWCSWPAAGRSGARHVPAGAAKLANGLDKALASGPGTTLVHAAVGLLGGRGGQSLLDWAIARG